MKLIPNWSQFKKYSIPNKLGVLSFTVGVPLAIVSLLLFFTFSPFQKWRQEKELGRSKEALGNYAKSKNWTLYDLELIKVESIPEARNMYLYYKGYGLMYRNRAIENSIDPNFYLKQIDRMSEYFPRSIICRLTWYKNNLSVKAEYVGKLQDMVLELRENEYFGTEYFLTKYLLLINDNEQSIDKVYSEFITKFKYVKGRKFNASFTFYSDDPPVDLSAYSKVVALNYLFLNKLLNHTLDQSSVTYAYEEIRRLYSTKRDLETVIIGLSELSLTKDGLSVDYLAQEVLMNVGLVVKS